MNEIIAIRTFFILDNGLFNNPKKWINNHRVAQTSFTYWNITAQTINYVFEKTVLKPARVDAFIALTENESAMIIRCAKFNKNKLKRWLVLSIIWSIIIGCQTLKSAISFVSIYAAF